MSVWPTERLKNHDPERKEVVEETKDICQRLCTSDFDGSAWDQEEMELSEGHVSTASSELRSPRPEDSDFLPSVRLAAVLFLIFALVSSLLLYCSAHQSPIDHSRRAARSNRVISQDHRLEKLRLLFPSQTEKTWWTIERSLHQRWLPDKPPDGVDVPFIAAALGGSRNTLLCLTKSLILLLSATEQVRFPVIRSQLVGSSRHHFRWGDRCTDEWPVLSVAVVGKRKGCAPHGIHVAVHCSLDGSPTSWKTTLSLHPETDRLVDGMIHNLTSNIASEILHSIDLTGRLPDTFWLTSMGSLPVLHVNSEHYLESDFVC